MPIPNWQWAALEQAASGQGLTMGQLLRRMIDAYLERFEPLCLTADASRANARGARFGVRSIKDDEE